MAYLLYLRTNDGPGNSIFLCLRVESIEQARSVVAKMRSTLAVRADTLMLKGPDGAIIERSELFDEPDNG